MDSNEKIVFFGELMRNGPSLLSWQLNAALCLPEQEQPRIQAAYELFSFNCGEPLKKHLAEAPGQPLALYDRLELSWIVVPEMLEGALQSVHILGPTFTSGVSLDSLRIIMRSCRYPATLTSNFEHFFQEIPITAYVSWMQYGQMLYHTVTGQRVSISDFRTYTAKPPQRKQPAAKMPHSSTWVFEQLAMEMIERGQLHYQEAFGRLSALQETFAPFESSSYTRMNKNAIISFITLATRAAIRGGLDPETAYYVGNSYIENVEKTSALPELARLNQMMYEDFIRRVQKVRENSGISQEIMAACNYIERHITEKISVDILAENAGYSKVYFSQKFRKEMGVSIGVYLKQQKIQRAKLLLQSTNLSIQEIGLQLGFCNNSYFAETFKSVTGISPGAYRENRTGGPID